MARAKPGLQMQIQTTNPTHEADGSLTYPIRTNTNQGLASWQWLSPAVPCPAAIAQLRMRGCKHLTKDDLPCPMDRPKWCFVGFDPGPPVSNARGNSQAGRRRELLPAKDFPHEVNRSLLPQVSL